MDLSFRLETAPLEFQMRELARTAERPLSKSFAAQADSSLSYFLQFICLIFSLFNDPIIDSVFRKS